MLLTPHFQCYVHKAYNRFYFFLSFAVTTLILVGEVPSKAFTPDPSGTYPGSANYDHLSLTYRLVLISVVAAWKSTFLCTLINNSFYS